MASLNIQSTFGMTGGLRHVLPGALLALACVGATADAWAVGDKQVDKKKEASIPFSAAKLIIEFNASAEDVGVQFFVDSEGWRTVRILDPFGKEIYQSTARGRLLEQGGGTELFVESVEPELIELPLEAFFEIFPAGTYTFVGRSPDGERLVSTAEFTHDIPAGPEIVMPAGAGGKECAENVPIPAVIAWNDVSTTIDGEPIDVVRYQVIVEHEDLEFSVFLDADGGTSVTVPSEFLTAGTDYIFEVLAIEEGGNQTISEGCFATSD